MVTANLRSEFRCMAARIFPRQCQVHDWRRLTAGGMQGKGRGGQGTALRAGFRPRSRPALLVFRAGGTGSNVGAAGLATHFLVKVLACRTHLADRLLVCDKQDYQSF
jgi:hypothetical protein